MFDAAKRGRGLIRINTRTKMLIYIAVASVYLVGVFVWGRLMSPDCYAVNYADKFLPPGAGHLFGADFMGRDMFLRSVKGLSNSLAIGLAAALVSSVVGLLFGVASALVGGNFDKFILLCVDCCMGLPHLVLMILISVLLGRGEQGVLFGVALTHWPELTRIVRAEVLQIRNSQYVQAARKLGLTKLRIASEHIFPHVLPMYSVGLVLLFPHAVMHESAITFLGFGLPAETPARGVILAEAMRHIATGKWWLALFPGLMLITAVMLFNAIGENLKKLLNPTGGNE
jgi:peptide/nickel transport system permease protein